MICFYFRFTENNLIQIVLVLFDSLWNQRRHHNWPQITTLLHVVITFVKKVKHVVIVHKIVANVHHQFAEVLNLPFLFN